MTTYTVTDGTTTKEIEAENDLIARILFATEVYGYFNTATLDALTVTE